MHANSSSHKAAEDENRSRDKWPLGVFASVDAGLGVSLDVLSELGVPTVQIHAPSPEKRTPAEAEDYLRRLSEQDIAVTAVFGGFDGESYADIPTVVKTVGLVPLATRAERLAEMKQISDFAKLMNCSVVALHLGFVPHDRQAEDYRNVVGITQELCDYVATNGQALHLETGQETAEALAAFINDCQRENLFINFDPANMILYGAGEPLPAVRMLGPWIRSVHCKDAKWAARPGEEWGEETPLGEGEVDIAAYLTALDEVGYTGPLTVEREIPQTPDKQKAEIGHAIELLARLKAELAG